MDSNPIHHPSAAKIMKCSFLDYIQLLMIDQAGRWTQTPSTIPSAAKKMKCFFGLLLMDGINIQPVSREKKWWMDLNPIHHPSPPKKMKCFFVLHWTSDDQPGWLMDSNPIHHLSPAKKWNAHILILLNFWWLAGLFNGLEPHPPPLSSQKNEMLIFGLCSTSDN